MACYRKPDTEEEALALMAAGGWTVLAGGTDFYPALGQRPVAADVLDISGLTALAGVAEKQGHWRIGAGTTWSALGRAALPPAFAALQAAAGEVGSVQIQNRATLGGNLCNASPAADGVPALLVLDAEAELVSEKRTRRLPLAEFLRGNRQTARRPDELLAAVLVPKASATGRSAFQKLGARRYLVISIAMAAARLHVEDGRIAAAAVAVGACSAVAQRLPPLEASLRGLLPSEAPGAVQPEHFAALSPIDDVRGSAAYRHEAAAEIVRRALSDALGPVVLPEAA